MLCSNIGCRYSAGSFGRECRAPFTCTERADEDGVRCKCGRAIGGNNCVSCDWTLTGNVCSMCGNNKVNQRVPRMCRLNAIRTRPQQLFLGWFCDLSRSGENACSCLYFILRLILRLYSISATACVPISVAMARPPSEAPLPAASAAPELVAPVSSDAV